MLTLDSLQVVLKLASSEFTGPMREAGETVKSSGSAMSAAGQQIKGALAEALNGTPIAEFTGRWQEAAEQVGGAAGEVEGAAKRAGSATKTALAGGPGTNQLAADLNTASSAAREFASVMTSALQQVRGELGMAAGSSGLEQLDTELQTTATDAQAAASQVVAAMTEIKDAEAGVSVGAGAGMGALSGELRGVGAAATSAGGEVAAGGSMIAGALSMGPEIAAITALTMVITKVPEAFKSAIEAGESYDDAVQMINQTTGATVTDSSLLVDVFQHFGISAQDTAKSIDLLSRAAVYATQGQKMYTDVFNQLNVSVKDGAGNIKSTTQLFYELMGALNKMPDGIEKTNAELTLFGRSGTQLNDMIHTSIQGFADLQQQAMKTGHVMTDQGMASFEKWQEATRNLSDANATLKQSLGNALIPLLTELAKGETVVADTIDTRLIPAGETVAKDFREVWTEAKPVRDIFGEIAGPAVSGLHDALSTLSSLLGGNFSWAIKAVAALLLYVLAVNLIEIIGPIVAVGLAIKGLELAFQHFGDVASGVKDEFKDAGSWLEKPGEELVEGFIKGIQNKLSDLWATIKSIPSGVISMVTNPLGINSPSTVMMGYGENTGQGYGLGVINSLPFVRSAVSRLAGIPLGMGGASMAPAMAGASVAGAIPAFAGAGTPQQIVVHNYMGQQPIETVVHRAMNGVFREQSRRQN